jgi:hypothetical protein
MPKIAYVDWNPSTQSENLIYAAEQIIEEYDAQGYTLTLRQLYYQFVSRNIIPNTERSYKNLGSLVTKARNAGMIDWSAIEDRARQFNKPWMDEHFNMIAQCPYFVRFDRWKRQSHYVEVWVEKEALGNVIEQACNPTHTPYLACKGYLSASEAWRAGRRLRDRVMRAGQQPVIIHLGDHDPSGIDMTRDNQDRLRMYAEDWGVQVERIALNMDQVDQYGPPPNPTKLSDTRARDYIAEHGGESWELDALEPKVIETLITDKIEEYIDRDVWHEVDEEEQDQKDLLAELHTRWDDVKEFLS